MTHHRVSRLDAAPRLAVVGATGAVGREMLVCLEKRNFPLSHLRLFELQRSAGASLPFKGRSIRIEELSAECFGNTDIALFSASAAVARRFAPLAVESGAVVIDNSSAFRLDPAVPLLVPEINAGELARHRGLIANPNCAAIISMVPLWPLHQVNRVRRLVNSTYQAASGGGAAAMQELQDATRAHLDGR